MEETNVENLTEHRLNNWAKAFVCIYEEEGGVAAGKFIYDNVPDDMRDSLRDKIREEFIYKGYNFPPKIDEE